MAKRVEVQLNHIGMGHLLRSAKVRRACWEKAKLVAAIANTTDPHHEMGPVEYYAGSTTTSQRGMAYVYARAYRGMAAEHKYRTLGRALKAAKGW
jgi:hypothetical protein